MQQAGRAERLLSCLIYSEEKSHSYMILLMNRTMKTNLEERNEKQDTCLLN